MTMKSDGKFKGKLICCLRNEKNLVSFDVGEFWCEHSKVSKICTLIGTFRAKHITFDLKKYRGNIFHNTEEPYKNSRKTDL